MALLIGNFSQMERCQNEIGSQQRASLRMGALARARGRAWAWQGYPGTHLHPAK